MLTKDAKESILSIQVDAALSGHNLGPFEPVKIFTGGYEARCRKCNQSAWVGDSGLKYSLLGERCLGNIRSCEYIPNVAMARWREWSAELIDLLEERDIPYGIITEEDDNVF